MNIRRHWFVINLISAAFAFLAMHLFLGYVGQRLEPYALDLLFHLRGAKEVPKDVVIITMDVESYKKLGLSPFRPWPRQKHAELLERLKVYEARRVAFDVAFQGQGESPESDRRFAEALALNPTVIVSDTVVFTAANSTRTEDLSPELIFAEKAESLGKPGFPIDSDGVIRRFLMPMWRAGQPLRSFSEAAAGTASLRFGRPSEEDYINFYGPAGTIETIPYHRFFDVENPVPIEALKDKVVFIGYFMSTDTHAQAKDSFITSSGAVPTFGVEIHATVAANLLKGDWIRRLPQSREVVLLAMAVFAVSFLMLSLKPIGSGLILLLISAAWTLTSYYCFLQNRFIPGLTVVLLVLPTIFLCTTLYYYFAVYRSQRRIRHAFAHYLMPEMVNRIAETPHKLELGGQLSEVTMLFSDIEGFTSWVEKSNPMQVSALLNSYFTEIGGIVLEHEGTLLKFIGDGMFVVWGAPIPVLSPSDCALNSALRIQEKVGELSKNKDFPLLRTRIGIHRGKVLVGNFGSVRRFDYTAIGDGVNTAARLEQLNKKFGTSILLSGNVLNNLKADFDLLSLGSVCVYGKEKAVPIYTVFGNDLSAVERKQWCAAIDLFQKKDWISARRIFEEICDRKKTLTEAARLYADFSILYQNLGVPDQWAGELRFDSKD